MSDPTPEAPPSPHAADPTDTLSCGLDRLMRDVDGGKGKNGTPAAAGGGEPASMTAAAAGIGTKASSGVAFPRHSGPAPTKAHSAPTSATNTPPTSQGAAALGAGTSAAITPPPVVPKPREPEARGTLVVSPPPPPKTDATTSAPPLPTVPVVTLSSKSPPTLIRKTGPKKMGARKLGAMKLGGGGAVKLSALADPAGPSMGNLGGGSTGVTAGGEDADLKFARKLQEEEDAAAAAAPSSRLAAAATAAFATPESSSSSTKGSLGTVGSSASIYRSANDSTGGYGYRNGGSSSSIGGSGGNGSYGRIGASSMSSSYASAGSGGGGGYGGSSGAFDKDKYKNVKGIGSDMLFGAQDDDPAEQARRAMKVQEYSGSAAISSDMYFDREAEGGGMNGGGGADGVGFRDMAEQIAISIASARMGFGDMTEQIAISAAAEFQGAAQVATKVKVRVGFVCVDTWKRWE